MGLDLRVLPGLGVVVPFLRPRADDSLTLEVLDDVLDAEFCEEWYDGQGPLRVLRDDPAHAPVTWDLGLEMAWRMAWAGLRGLSR